VYGPHHTPMLRGCIIAGTKERFEGHTPSQHPQNCICVLGGSSPINLRRRNEAQCLVWGVRGAFLPLAAMVVTVFCSLPEHEQLFPVEPQHNGYRQKALVSSKTILAFYRGQPIGVLLRTFLNSLFAKTIFVFHPIVGRWFGPTRNEVCLMTNIADLVAVRVLNLASFLLHYVILVLIIVNERIAKVIKTRSLPPD